MTTIRLALVALSLVAFGCGSEAPPAMTDGGATVSDAGAAFDGLPAPSDLAPFSGACVAVARTCDDILAAFALNTADVKVSCDAARGTFTFSATVVLHRRLTGTVCVSGRKLLPRQGDPPLFL